VKFCESALSYGLMWLGLVDPAGYKLHVALVCRKCELCCGVFLLPPDTEFFTKIS
jgi:hypothetical protein